MALAYEYPTKRAAEVAIQDGTALAFFQPFIDIAIENAWEPTREFWKPEDARLCIGGRKISKGYYRSGPSTWQVYLIIDHSNRNRYGYGDTDTDIVMRKGGDVNQETLNEAVYGLLYKRHSDKAASDVRAANKKRIVEELPEEDHAYVEAEGTEGSFRLRFKESGVTFDRTVSFGEISPILLHLRHAAFEIDAIRYPDQKES